MHSQNGRNGVSKALSEQQEQAAEALAQQDKILRQQLSEQQAEASRERATKAAADMIAGTVELWDASRKTLDEITVIQHRLQAAAWRWYMEEPEDFDLAEVVSWANHLSLLAYKANREVVRKSKGEEFDETAGKRLSSACLSFQATATHWPSSDRDGRKLIIEALKAEREENNSFWSKDYGVPACGNAQNLGTSGWGRIAKVRFWTVKNVRTQS